MEIEKGVVVELSNNKILVESGTAAGCSTCAARNSCMTGTEHLKRRLWIENTRGARIGDTVSFRIEENAVLFSSFLLYFVPVVLMITGIIIGTKKSAFFNMSEDLAGAVTGGIGIIVSVIIIKVVSSILVKKKNFVPLLIDIITVDDLKECD